MIWLLVISAAVNAFIYNSVLIKEGHILYNWHRWLTKLFSKQVRVTLKDCTPEEVKNMPGYEYTPLVRIETRKHWILSPLGDCPLCMAGQFVLWGIIAINFLPSLSLEGYQIARTAWYIITMICTSILLVTVLQKLSERGHS